MDMNSILYDEVDIMVEASDIVDLSDEDIDKTEMNDRDIAIDNDVEDIVDDEDEDIEESLFVNDIATIAVEEYSKFVYEHGNIFDEYDDILENIINDDDLDNIEEDEDYENIDEFMTVGDYTDDTPVTKKKSNSLFDEDEDEDDTNFFLPEKEPGETIKPSNIGKDVLDESFDIFI